MQAAACTHMELCARRTPEERRRRNALDEAAWRRHPTKSYIRNDPKHLGLAVKPQQPEDKPPMNLRAKTLRVKHAELRRADDNSVWRKECPACANGILLVRRGTEDAVLQADDRCISCGQHVVYDDIEIMRKNDGAK